MLRVDELYSPNWCRSPQSRESRHVIVRSDLRRRVKYRAHRREERTAGRCGYEPFMWPCLIPSGGHTRQRQVGRRHGGTISDQIADPGAFGSVRRKLVGQRQIKRTGEITEYHRIVRKVGMRLTQGREGLGEQGRRTFGHRKSERLETVVRGADGEQSQSD